jgi:hypothetical protein
LNDCAIWSTFNKDGSAANEGREESLLSRKGCCGHIKPTAVQEKVEYEFFRE